MEPAASDDQRFQVSESSPYHQKRIGLEQPVGSRLPRAVTLGVLAVVLVLALVAIAMRWG